MAQKTTMNGSNGSGLWRGIRWSGNGASVTGSHRDPLWAPSNQRRRRWCHEPHPIVMAYPIPQAVPAVGMVDTNAGRIGVVVGKGFSHSITLQP